MGVGWVSGGLRPGLLSDSCRLGAWWLGFVSGSSVGFWVVVDYGQVSFVGEV